MRLIWGIPLAVVAISAGLFFWLKPRPVDPCPIEFGDAYSVTDATAQQRGRVYIFGSLNILSGASLTDELTKRGFQVVSIAIPQIAPCLYRGDGFEYSATVAKALRSVVSNVEGKYGPAKSIIGGGSIGGIHAMIGYALVPRFSGWFASMSVTKMTALKEFKGISNPSFFDPFFQVTNLKSSTGFMTWGTADTRVDYKLSQELYAEIKSPSIAFVEYEGMEHDTTDRQIADLVGWIDKNF